MARGYWRRIAVLAAALAGLTACDDFVYWEGDELPRRLGTPTLLSSASEYYGRESCVYAVFRLQPAVLEAIRRDGLAFLGDDTHPASEHPRNRYGPWQATPYPITQTLFAIYAEGGCSKRNKTQIDPYRVLPRPGNFLTLTENEEGMILIDAERGLVAFLYAG